MNKTMIAMALFAMALGSDVISAKNPNKNSKTPVDFPAGITQSTPTKKQKAADTAKDILDRLGQEEPASSPSFVNSTLQMEVLDAPAPAASSRLGVGVTPMPQPSSADSMPSMEPQLA